MHNLIILGSGRSGTSLLTGMLAKSGYFTGDNYIEINDANPKGFFEDREVNNINEDIITLSYNQQNPIQKIFATPLPEGKTKWLAMLPNRLAIKTSLDIKSRIENLVSNQPFCFKDPRFSYTLPAWDQFAKPYNVICIFRNPLDTTTSILKECHQNPYLNDFGMTHSRALKIWNSIHSYVLNYHDQFGSHWYFIHYEQLFNSDFVSQLEKNLNVSLDKSFPESKLHRSKTEGTLNGKTRKIYQQLCDLANYQ